MCHLYPYNNAKLLRKFFYINLYKTDSTSTDQLIIYTPL